MINPFTWATRYVRSRMELEQEYEERSVRNPIGNTPEHLGKFLDVVCEKRHSNRGAADYILTTLLLGARRNETAALTWVDRITFAERTKYSYVDLHRNMVRFKDTKSGNHHELPLGPFLKKLLTARHRDDRSGVYVFPASSKNPKTKSKFYNSPREFVDSLRKALDEPIKEQALIEALAIWRNDFIAEKKKEPSEVAKKNFIKRWDALYVPTFYFTMHDLRRTFCTVAVLTDGLPYAVVRRLMNHGTLSDVTARYGKVGVEDLRFPMERLEGELLRYASKLPLL